MRGEEAVGGPVTPLGLSAAPAAANKGGFWLFWDFFCEVGVWGVWGWGGVGVKAVFQSAGWEAQL